MLKNDLLTYNRILSPKFSNKCMKISLESLQSLDLTGALRVKEAHSLHLTYFADHNLVDFALCSVSDVCTTCFCHP